jgi:HK97 family phage major capsid protein/HK97 family phage prohead protease
MASYKPTEGMITEAERGLAWRREFGRGGTEVGIARARDISNGKRLSESTVKRMKSFFARHEVDKKAEGFRPGEKGYPSNGRIAWALWGGDAGQTWSNGIVDIIDKEQDRAFSDLSDEVQKGLQRKADEHNEEYGDSATKRTNVRTLAAVFERGVGAYKTNPGSVRPTVSSPEQWAYSRVNSFLYVLRNGKFKSGKHDTDLLPSGHPMSSKERSSIETIEMESENMTDLVETNEEVVEEIIEVSETQERHVVAVEETDETVTVTFEKHHDEAEAETEEVEEVEEVEVETSSYDEEERFSPTEIQHRASDMKTGAIDEETRRVKIAVSSETPVERSFGKEILDHTESSVDLSFAKSGRMPLLLDHDPKQTIGVVEDVTLDSSSRVLRATVRFGKNGMAKEMFDDVTDGIRSNISVGYQVNKMQKEDADSYRVNSWRVMEVSLVSIPADENVGIGRSKDISPEPVTEIIETKETIMSDIDINVVADEARSARNKEVAAIIELGAKHQRSDIATKAVAENKSLDQFRGELLEVIGDKPLETAEVGLSKDEVREFSVMRAIRAMANPSDRQAQEEARFEMEVSEAAQRATGRSARGVMLPTEVLRSWAKRDVNTSDDSALIAEDFRGGDFVDVLRNASSVMAAGATVLNGLQGDVVIPKKSAASTAGWIATEGAASGESEPTFGQITMSPKVVGAHTQITRLMMQQSSLDIENLIRNDLAQGIALSIDAGALSGSGSSGQPTGISNTAGINTPTAFAGVNPTFAEVVAMETAVAEDNALLGNLAYILPASMFGALKTTAKDAGSGQFVVGPDGQINGYNAIVSNQVTAGDLYFGNFADALIGLYGGLDIVVDPYSNSTSGTVNVTALQTVDVAVRHAVSFAYNNDGA